MRKFPKASRMDVPSGSLFAWLIAAIFPPLGIIILMIEDSIKNNKDIPNDFFSNVFGVIVLSILILGCPFCVICSIIVNGLFVSSTLLSFWIAFLITLIEIIIAERVFLNGHKTKNDIVQFDIKEIKCKIKIRSLICLSIAVIIPIIIHIAVATNFKNNMNNLVNKSLNYTINNLTDLGLNCEINSTHYYSDGRTIVAVIPITIKNISEREYYNLNSNVLYNDWDKNFNTRVYFENFNWAMTDYDVRIKTDDNKMVYIDKSYYIDNSLYAAYTPLLSCWLFYLIYYIVIFKIYKLSFQKHLKNENSTNAKPSS